MGVTRAVGWWVVPSPGYAEHEASPVLFLAPTSAARPFWVLAHPSTAALALSREPAVLVRLSSSASHWSLETHLVIKTCFSPLLIWVL